MKNKYELRGDIAAVLLTSRKHGAVEFLISIDKLERVKQVQWHVAKRRSRFYITGHIKISKNKYINFELQRFITSAPKGMEVDHINHDTLNNTNENLRIVTVSENQQNRSGVPSNNTTKIMGVHWHKGKGKWEVQITVNGKKINLGRYSDIKDAEKAVKEGRAKHMPYSKEAI